MHDIKNSSVILRHISYIFILNINIKQVLPPFEMVLNVCSLCSCQCIAPPTPMREPGDLNGAIIKDPTHWDMIFFFQIPTITPGGGIWEI